MWAKVRDTYHKVKSYSIFTYRCDPTVDIGGPHAPISFSINTYCGQSLYVQELYDSHHDKACGDCLIKIYP